MEFVKYGDVISGEFRTSKDGKLIFLRNEGHDYVIGTGKNGKLYASKAAKDETREGANPKSSTK